MTVILLIGATGQIGHELLQELAPLGRVVAPTRAELDLGDRDSILRAVRAIAPDAIVNAGAYTAVDRAESDEAACARVNADAPGVLAEEARRGGATLVHYSTDYVFDGAARTPYAEDDEPHPLQAYGRTKLAGERAIQAVGGSYVILRTSWVYGLRGRNFLRTVLAKASGDGELRVVDDQVGAPTWSRMVADGTAQVVRQLLGRVGGRGGAPGDRSGIYHMTAAGSTTWHAFAERILASAPPPAARSCGRVQRVSSADFAAPARRPTYSVLSNEKSAGIFGVRLPDWRDQLARVVRELDKGAPP
jgi:dTDP-4-dehydrorhamnose reductase